MKKMQNGVSKRDNACLGGASAITKKLLLAVWMGVFLLGFGKVSLAAEGVIATVPVGTNPIALAINPVTNNIYVVNYGSNNLTAINGSSNTTTTIPLGDGPGAIAVNTLTNKIYVTNTWSGNVTVIDGITNGISTVTVGTHPNAIAIDQVTNRIYVVNNASHNVTVIDGVTDTIITTVSVGIYPDAVDVNPSTNKIYVANNGTTTVTVIDGGTYGTSTVSLGFTPWAVKVNPSTNKIYVASQYSGSTVALIDGVTNGVTPLAVGSGPFGMAVNPVTDKIYVPSYLSNNATVIDGLTDNISTIAMGSDTIYAAVNAVTNKIYMSGYSTGSVKVIDGTSNVITTINVGSNPYPIAVNQNTNRAYVANSGSNTVSVIGELDSTPPVISSSQTPLANANGWNNTDVTVTFTATDDVSVPTCTVNSAILATESAGQSVSTTCTDAAGNSATAAVSNINIDKTAPMLILPSLASNYTVGSSALISFDAIDTLSGLASVSATLNGNPVSSGSTIVLNQLGTNTFTLTASDKAGNSETQTVLFTVTYDFGGFLPPLTADSRTNFHLGSVIPVKFDLYDASGAAVSTAVARLSLQKLFNGDPIGDPIDATPTSGADSGNLFRYNGGHYAYNLSTKPFTAGIWRIQATLDDGTVRTIDIGLTSK